MIVGLIVLVGLILYLILTLVLVIANVRSARKEGKSGWVRGSVVLGFMYLLLFWDWIPVRVAIQHDCASEGGFTVNKTLDQWKAENPGVAETLVPYKNVTSEKSGEKTRYQLNQRFAWDIRTTHDFLGIEKRDERIVDTKTREVLAQYVDFNSGQNQLNPERPRDFKLWLWLGSCPRGYGETKWVTDGDSFRTLKNKAKNINGVM